MHVFRESLSFQKLHDQVGHSVPKSGIRDRHDVWMIELSGSRDLLMETFHDRRFQKFSLPDQFDGKFTFQNLMLTGIDLPHPALPERLRQKIGRNGKRKRKHFLRHQLFFCFTASPAPRRNAPSEGIRKVLNTRLIAFQFLNILSASNTDGNVFFHLEICSLGKSALNKIVQNGTFRTLHLHSPFMRLNKMNIKIPEPDA